MVYDSIRFINALKKRDAGDLFDFKTDGTFSVRLICLSSAPFKSLHIEVKFNNGIAIITTDVGIGITEINLKTIKVLMRCINKYIWGAFFISENLLLCRRLEISIDDFENLEEPFDAIHYGEQRFSEYAVSILKAAAGDNVTVWHF